MISPINFPSAIFCYDSLYRTAYGLRRTAVDTVVMTYVGFSIAVVVSKSGQVQESVREATSHINFPSCQPRLTSQKRSGTLAAKMDYQRRDDDEEDEALHLKIGDGSHDDAESSPPAAGECAADDAAQNEDEDEDMQAAAPALVSGKAEVTSPRVGRIGRFFKPRVLPWERRLHRRSHLIVQRSNSTATLSTRCSVLVPPGTRKVTSFDAQSASHL